MIWLLLSRHVAAGAQRVNPGLGDRASLITAAVGRETAVTIELRPLTSDCTARDAADSSNPC
jgi:hypothetical protein